MVRTGTSNKIGCNHGPLIRNSAGPTIIDLNEPLLRVKQVQDLYKIGFNIASLASHHSSSSLNRCEHYEAASLRMALADVPRLTFGVRQGKRIRPGPLDADAGPLASC